MNWFSMVIALFGGLCLFSMTKHLLKGKRAEAKFITMKLVVAVPFFQTFLLDWLERRHHIKATRKSGRIIRFEEASSRNELFNDRLLDGREH